MFTAVALPIIVKQSIVDVFTYWDHVQYFIRFELEQLFSFQYLSYIVSVLL